MRDRQWMGESCHWRCNVHPSLICQTNNEQKWMNNSGMRESMHWGKKESWVRWQSLLISNCPQELKGRNKGRYRGKSWIRMARGRGMISWLSHTQFVIPHAHKLQIRRIHIAHKCGENLLDFLGATNIFGQQAVRILLWKPQILIYYPNIRGILLWPFSWAWSPVKWPEKDFDGQI